MTEEQINKLEAGRELNALIHTDVMGRTYRVSDGNMDLLYSFGDYADEGEYIDTSNHGGEYHVRQERIPEYSTDIAAVWQVVEKLSERYHWEIRSPFEPGKHWYVGLTPHGCSGWNGRADYRMIGDTAPLAICRVALLEALGEPQL